jgi:SnoaL-like polyketide cyclase
MPRPRKWVSEGIQTGPIGDLPASGNNFRLRGISILSFHEGKIATVTDHYDATTFLRQLGTPYESLEREPDPALTASNAALTSTLPSHISA